MTPAAWDVLSQRLDALLAESQRIETELLAAGETNRARDIACFALELMLARRSLNAALTSQTAPPPVDGVLATASRGSIHLVGTDPA